MWCKKLRLVLSLTILALYGESGSVAGRTEICQRLHAFSISNDVNDTNRTSLTYMNTHATEPVVVTFEDSLPSLLLCGTHYYRCNAVVTSNADKTVKVVLFPLDLGIGLASFNYSAHDDTLIYWDQFLLPQNVPDCTFVYFVVLVNAEIIGYCLELYPPRIRAFKIHIEFFNLAESSILRRQDTFEISDLNDIASLSNFVLFVRERHDNCFDNEGNHVLFLSGGEVYDHSYLDGRIYHTLQEIDATCSSLHRVRGMCNVVARCNSSTLVFDTRGQGHNSVFTDAEYGQTFFCPSEDFASFQNKTLTLHHLNSEKFGNSVLFPFGEIHQGHCLNVVDNFFLVATVDEGRAVLVNFSDMSYQQLGDSDFSIVPVKVKGHLAIVNNGNETRIYNLGLACMPEPLVLPKNFVLATSAFFSPRALDECQCLDPSTTTTISPIEPSVPTISPTVSSSFAELVSSSSPFILSFPTTLEPWLSEMASTVSLSFPTTLEPRLSEMASTVSPSSTPLPDPINLPGSSLLSGGGVAGIVVSVLFVVAVIVITLLVVGCVCWWWRKKKSSSITSTLEDQSDGLNSGNVKLKNFNTDNFKGSVDVGGQSNPIHEYEVQKNPNGGMHVGLLERQESSDSQRTQIQTKELTPGAASTSSECADTSAASSGPHTHTLVLKNPVRQEVGDGVTTDEQSDPELDTREDNSDEIICQPESHQDKNDESSLITTSSPLVLQLSPTNSEDNYIYPTDATSNDPSQLYVGPLNFRESHFSNNQLSSAASLHGIVNGDCLTDVAQPMQDTDRSNSGFMVGGQHSGAAVLSPLSDDVKAKYQQTTDQMNTLPFRLRTVEVAGGTPWNGEPDAQQSIDMYM